MDGDNLNGFRTHGVEFTRYAGSQAVADCPFCDKKEHFYANKETKLWDCKRCGEQGNFEDFLAKIADKCFGSVSETRLAELGKDRSISTGVLAKFGVGWNGNRYTIPIRNSTGRTVDIRLFRLGNKLHSTPTASTGLFNSPDLAVQKNVSKRVYLCEGEWDAMALWGCLGRSSISGGREVGGVVVGVPGANTFKDSWIKLFEGREVWILYDNDLAGENGEGVVRRKLSGVAKKLRYLHWGDKFGAGYDIRDLVRDKGDQAFELISEMMRDVPRKGIEGEGNGAQPHVELGKPEEDFSPEALEPITTRELIDAYKKWLHMSSVDALKVIYGVLMANKLGGDPLWLFLVAPPGGSKSELLMSLAKCRGTHAISSLTPHSMISGASWKDGQDPSLLPQLQGKVLIIKDFTTLLTMNENVRDEIFGVLRDVYDGQTEKVFGNGVKRKYEVHFGILAGVTPVIETFNIMHQSLGERFLKFRISGNWDQVSEKEKILRALGNVGQEGQMRSELQVAAARWVEHSQLPEKLPELDDEMKLRLVHLAKFSARLRGVVERDRYNGSVLYKPSSEVGTRIAKQLAKLGIGVAMFLGKKRLDKEVYALVRRVALDTVPDRVEDIIRGLWTLSKGERTSAFKTQDLVAYTRFPQATIFRVLQDMNLLRLVELVSEPGKSNMWRLSEVIMEHIECAELYSRNWVSVETVRKEFEKDQTSVAKVKKRILIRR